MRKQFLSAVSFLLFALLCISQSTRAAAVKKSLYERLGGKKALVAVVDDFVNNVGHDKRINHFFAKTVASQARFAHFKKELVDFICMATGGPCKYTGKNMVAAHAGMGISKSDFNALVEDLVKTLNKFHVPQEEQKELLGLLGPLEPQIVSKK